MTPKSPAIHVWCKRDFIAMRSGEVPMIVSFDRIQRSTKNRFYADWNYKNYK